MVTVNIDLKNAFEVLCDATQDASKALLEVIKNGFEKSFKVGDDPVTTGDLTVNKILQEKLFKAFPEIGWLSEETRDNSERLSKEFVWIVDPIDGTREFVDSIPEYAISIALVKNGKPVLSVVLNPLKSELYTAIKGLGAYLNGEEIRVSDSLKEKPRILASRSETKRGEWGQFENSAEVIPTGSIAYKLALVASGKADGTFSLGNKHEWDIAAGYLLIEEAGGKVSDQYGQDFIFNQENTLVDSIVGTSSVAHKTIFEIIEKSRN